MDQSFVHDPRAEMTALTGMMREALQSMFNDLRDSVNQSIGDVKEDVQRKANMNELAALSNRLDAWTQSSPPLKDRRRAKGGEDAEVDGSTSPAHDGTALEPTGATRRAVTSSGYDGRGPPSCGVAKTDKPASSHDRCKLETCPRSLS